MPTIPTKDILPSRVRAERKRLRMSQEQLGVKAGLSGRTVARLESGGWTPRIETIDAIAEALGINPVDLLTDGIDTGEDCGVAS